MGSLNNLLTSHSLFPPDPCGTFPVPTLLTPGYRPPASLPQWIYASARFRRFLANIEPTPNQHGDVATKVDRIIATLNRVFWSGPISAPYTSHIPAGSWAKGTRVRPSSDRDMIFLLPRAIHDRYTFRIGNRQSGILQEVKNALQPSYPTTPIKCDGPTVIMNFSSYKVEIAPAFLEAPARLDDTNLIALLCDSNNGGSYKRTAPIAEQQKITQLDQLWNGDLVALICMAKTWKRVCNVQIKAFFIEQIGMEFLAQWPNAGKGTFWYDWMMRDFFRFMSTRRNAFNLLPVTNEAFFYGDAWLSRANTAAATAARACAYEQTNLNAAAGDEWQKLFGIDIPREA